MERERNRLRMELNASGARHSAGVGRSQPKLEMGRVLVVGGGERPGCDPNEALDRMGVAG